MDDPPAPDVDPHMPYLARPRARAMRAEEDDVPRLKEITSEPRRARDLSAHCVGRPPLQHLRERGCSGERFELVDPPREPRAVEAAGHLLAEERLRTLRRTAPDVRRANQPERTSEHEAPPLRQMRECEGL